MRWWIALVLVLTVALGGPAVAEDLPGLEELRAEALKGDVESQYELGILYEYGFRLEVHRPPALAWYTIAARSGHALAAKRRDALEAAMTSDELATARRLTEEYGAASTRVPTTPNPSTATPPSTPSSPASPPDTVVEPSNLQ